MRSLVPISRGQRTIRLWLLGLSVFAALCGAKARDNYTPVEIPSGIQHDGWDTLVKRYVDARGLVAYGKWKANAADRRALDQYLAQFANQGTQASGNELAASGINAYNAFAIRWILENYPAESIQALPDSFKRKAHLIGGTKVSLDDIEHGTLRPLLGYRVHAALVCCARSCPPLPRFAYRTDMLEGQIETEYRTWLAREDLNHFMPGKNRAEISKIFKWFKADFEKAGGIPRILVQYGPSSALGFLNKGGYQVEYLPYHWGLNDQGGRGKDYSGLNLIFDSLF